MSDLRYDRERRFHNDIAGTDHRAAVGKYYAVDVGTGRYHAALVARAGPGTHVLEYGCGTGSAAFELAGAGATVTGIDISDEAIRQARQRAEQDGLACTFTEMNAERLDLAGGRFDLVCGSGILHHLDLDRALDEVARVLAPSGRAVFYEPLAGNPLIALYRRLTPKMRTPDEHPLTEEDLRRLRHRFATVVVERFTLFALLAVPVARRPWGRRLVTGLQRLDAVLLGRFPRLGPLAWVVVIDVSGPIEPPQGA